MTSKSTTWGLGSPGPAPARTLRPAGGPGASKSPAVSLEESAFQLLVLCHFRTGAPKPDPVLVSVHRALRWVPSDC